MPKIIDRAPVAPTSSTTSSTPAPAPKNTAAAPAPEKKSGWGALGGVFKKVADGFSEVGAGSIGIAELAGLRYPVSHYEFKVSDNLTRGSRIDDPKGYDSLKAQGFKGIFDLTAEGTNDEQYAEKAGLNLGRAKIIDNTNPTIDQMKQFLDFATNPKNEPCYVHCEAGKGRTGVAVCCYRMAVQGWSADQAIAEGVKFGMVLPNQQDFVRQFGAALAAGKVDGYPKPALP